MKSKKLLYIMDLAFNLPDDFNGSASDALTLALQYHISGEAKEKRKILPDTPDNALKDLLSKPNIKLSSLMIMTEYDEKTDTFINSKEVK